MFKITGLSINNFNLILNSTIEFVIDSTDEYVNVYYFQKICVQDV